MPDGLPEHHFLHPFHILAMPAASARLALAGIHIPVERTMRKNEDPKPMKAETEDEPTPTAQPQQLLGVILLFLGFGGALILLILIEVLRKLMAT